MVAHTKADGVDAVRSADRHTQIINARWQSAPARRGQLALPPARSKSSLSTLTVVLSATIPRAFSKLCSRNDTRSMGNTTEKIHGRSSLPIDAAPKPANDVARRQTLSGDETAPTTSLPAGAPWPLGVCWIESENAVSFALYSRHATGVTLLCYTESDPAKPVFEFRFQYPVHKTGSIWHCQV